jgi:hypothetical protein
VDSAHGREDFLDFIPSADIPEECLAALRRYLATDFGIVDSALRRLDDAQLKELDEFVRLITHGLFKLPSFRGVVFRGASLSSEAIAQYVPGNIVFEYAFISTTADPARRFPGTTTFVIASINGRDVSMLTEIPQEREVLFFTGTRFKVLATEHDAHADDWYIYLAEIPDRRLLQTRPEQ